MSNGRVDFKTVRAQSRLSIRQGGVPVRFTTLWAPSAFKPFKNAAGARVLQAARLQRLLRFCHSIACTVATLAYVAAR